MPALGRRLTPLNYLIKYRTVGSAGIDKRLRSTSSYHSRQCGISLNPRSDRIDYAVVCLVTHDVPQPKVAKTLP